MRFILPATHQVKVAERIMKNKGYLAAIRAAAKTIEPILANKRHMAMLAAMAKSCPTLRLHLPR